MKYRAIQANGHHYVVRPDGSMVSFGDRVDSRLDAEGFADLKNGDLPQAQFKAGPVAAPEATSEADVVAQVTNAYGLPMFCWGIYDHGN